MNRKGLLYLIFSALCCLPLQARIRDNANWPTYISPYYFGPNAFPVPQMKTRTADKIEAEVSADYVSGHIAEIRDVTATVNFGVKLPLWSRRAELAIWGQAYEWHRDSPATLSARKAEEGAPLSGHQFGDIYFSIAANVLMERASVPGITIRAACKTASGEGGAARRYYDAPGYFIDASIFKTFRPGNGHSVSLAASTGFLCWQTKADRQNDAVMYGISLGYEYNSIIRLSSEFSGYYGWRHDGDSPSVLKIKILAIPDKIVSPLLEYDHGFRDWPFDLLRLGIRVQAGG
ncbi:MAG: hypothetical protein MJY62_04380 [Bacteroidales bacterium]|nr:hypothetical protein [Bacteroidales bacterium]